jgi:hypothetical protein
VINHKTELLILKHKGRSKGYKLHWNKTIKLQIFKIMKLLKNSVVGIVSFMGSIPLGYLNIVGLKFTTALDSKSAFISIRE